MIKRLLIGLTETERADAAIRYGIEIAGTQGADLTGIAIMDVRKIESTGPVPVGGIEYAKQMEERRRRDVEGKIEAVMGKFGAACREANVRHEELHPTGDPYDLIVGHARYHDLTILGLHHFFDYDVVAETKDAVCRLFHKQVRPILAVPERFRPIRRALIAYSGSMGSAQAMRRFVQMRLWPDAELAILHAGEDGRLLSDASAYCERHGYRTSAALVPFEGKATILRRAGEIGADLIVMGNGAHNPLVRKITGDVVRHTVLHADVPLYLSS